MKRLTFFDNSVELHIIESVDFINENSSELDKKVAFLSTPEQEKLSRFTNLAAKYTYLTAHYYLREILSQKLNENPGEILIETSDKSKPFLKNHPSLFFNISHTNEMVIIALAHKPIGVDVENMTRNSDKENILKHFFSQKEQDSYYSQKDKDLAFYTGWTRKESVLKATGEGLSSMKSNEVSFAIEEKALISCEDCGRFLVETFCPATNYCASVTLIVK